jgi:hypothetical protein
MTPSKNVLTIPACSLRAMPSKTRRNSTSTHDHVVSDHSDNEEMTPRFSRRSRAEHSRHRIKHYVEHNYHDHKHDPIVTVLPNLALTDDHSCHRPTGHRGGVATPFPEKLHELLESASEHGLDEIIGWQPHGRCFVVHKPKQFVEDIMPQ